VVNAAGAATAVLEKPWRSPLNVYVIDGMAGV
jgi:hypothetical protein